MDKLTILQNQLVIMNAQELRIGNWIGNPSRHPEHYFQVTPEDIDIIAYGESTAQPIPISPEILTKIGFEKVDVGSPYYENWKGPRSLYISKCLTIVNGGYESVAGEWYMGENHTHIPNLHWLQNYVFFTYKFELEIDL